MDNNEHLALAPADQTPETDDLGRLVAWVKQNPIPVAAGGLIVLGMITGGGENYAQQSQTGASLQEQRMLADQTVRQQKLEAKAYQEALEVGAMRLPYCVRIEPTDPAKQGQPVGLTEGMRVVDPTTQQPLPDGTVVCDPYGWTGVLRGGAITSLAPAPPPATAPAPQTLPQQTTTTQEAIYVPLQQN